MSKISRILLAPTILLFPALLFAQTGSPTPSTSPSGQSSTDFATSVGQQIDSRLSQADPNTGLKIYNSLANKLAQRNPNSWVLKGVPLDFTGISGWSETLNTATNANAYIPWVATMITPRHFVTASHIVGAYPYMPIGSTVTFFDKNSNPFTYTISSMMDIGNDITVGILDRNVDSSITSYQLIDNTTLLGLVQKSFNQKFDVPIIVFNQYRASLVRQFDTIAPNTTGIDHNLYASGVRAAFSQSIIPGDSSGPGFLAIGGKAILLGTNSAPSTLSDLGAKVDAINAAIDTLGNNGYHASLYTPPSSYAKYSASFPPATAFTATANSGCLSGAGQGKVVLTWGPPMAQENLNNYYVTNYLLSIDGGQAISLPSTPLDNLSYTMQSVGAGSSHNYSLTAQYTSNVSAAVTAQATVPNVCATQSSSPSPVTTYTPTPTPTHTVLPVVTATYAPTYSPTVTPTPTKTPVVPVKSASSGSNTNSSSGGSAQNQSSVSSGGGSGGSASGSALISYPAPTIQHSLGYGSTGNDVELLQRLLNVMGFTIANVGPGSYGYETTYFGSATKAALIRYQVSRMGASHIANGILDSATLNSINADITKINNLPAAKVSVPTATPQTYQNVPQNNVSKENVVPQNSASSVPATTSSSGFVNSLVNVLRTIGRGFQNFLHAIKLF